MPKTLTTAMTITNPNHPTADDGSTVITGRGMPLIVMEHIIDLMNSSMLDPDGRFSWDVHVTVAEFIEMVDRMQKPETDELLAGLRSEGLLDAITAVEYALNPSAFPEIKRFRLDDDELDEYRAAYRSSCAYPSHRDKYPSYQHRSNS